MDSILTSFKINNTLCPDFWDNHDSSDFSEVKLKPEVRRVLLRAAQLFIDTLEIEVFNAEDIILTGSISNYNWSKYSDADLHILTDGSAIDPNEDVLSGFFNAKGALFNDKIEDASVKGHDIELYVQDINEKHTSTGVYSIIKNTWIIQPSKENFKIDLDAISRKKERFIAEIDKIAKKSEQPDIDSEALMAEIESLREKIKKYRQSGLSANGESSEENLVFKYLRRSDYLDKLSKLKTKLLNNILTIEGQKVS